MKKLLTVAALSYLLSASGTVSAHCQMPCGIYHDAMVYDQIDQYVETMYKGITVLNDNLYKTDQEKNVFVRWVMTKEKLSNETSELILEYFLQQKIKPDEPNTVERLKSAHKLLCLIVQIKQNADRTLVNKFSDEWEKFKLMFHVEGYECQIEMIKLRKLADEHQKKKEAEKSNNHEHEHSHGDHDHRHESDHKH